MNIYKLWVYGKIDKAIVMYPRRMVCKPTCIDDRHLTYWKAEHFLKDKEVKEKIYWRCEDKDFAARPVTAERYPQPLWKTECRVSTVWVEGASNKHSRTDRHIVYTFYGSRLRCRRWIRWRGFFHWRDSMQVSGSWHRFWRRTLAGEIVITAHRDFRFHRRVLPMRLFLPVKVKKCTINCLTKCSTLFPITYFAKEANDAFTSHFPQADVNGHY